MHREHDGSDGTISAKTCPVSTEIRKLRTELSPVGELARKLKGRKVLYVPTLLATNSIASQIIRELERMRYVASRAATEDKQSPLSNITHRHCTL